MFTEAENNILKGKILWSFSIKNSEFSSIVTLFWSLEWVAANTMWIKIEIFTTNIGGKRHAVDMVA